jgi:hypothetical protein
VRRNRSPLLLVALFSGCDASLPGEHEEPVESRCAQRTDRPPSAEALLAAGVDLGFAARPGDPGEASSGLAFVDALPELAPAAPSLAAPLPGAAVSDGDGDCLPDEAELAARTSATNPDSDGDGWFDGPCNERRRLVLRGIAAHGVEERLGGDELYLVVDDRRFPTSSDLDGYWRFAGGERRRFSLTLAERVRGTDTSGALATVRVEGWEDDVEAVNRWRVDDLLFGAGVNLGAYPDGGLVTLRKPFAHVDYELTLEVVIDHFADPQPTSAGGDADADGIRDAAEHHIARELGGIADPERREVFVELDWMRGHPLDARARRLVTTRLATQGLTLQVRPSEELPVDPCLTRAEARALFQAHFQSQRYQAFRYALMTEVIWTNGSGAALSETFFVDDSTPWIAGSIVPQAGTFIHELGHTLGLTKVRFRLIDTLATPTYDSAMNYSWQPYRVDYSHDGRGGTSNDHDDWAAVDPAAGLRSSFGQSIGDEEGVCR